MTEHERMTKLIDALLAALERLFLRASPGEACPLVAGPGEASAMIAGLESLVTSRAMLGEEPDQRTTPVTAHEMSSKESDQTSQSLRRWLVERDATIAELREYLGQSNTDARGWIDRLVERDGQIVDLRDQLEQSNMDRARLVADCAARDRWLVERDGQIADLRDQLGQSNMDRAGLVARIKELEAPLQFRSLTGMQATRLREAARHWCMSPELDELLLAIKELESAPRPRGLSTLQASTLKAAADHWCTKPELDELLLAIEANTISPREHAT